MWQRIRNSPRSRWPRTLSPLDSPLMDGRWPSAVSTNAECTVGSCALRPSRRSRRRKRLKQQSRPVEALQTRAAMSDVTQILTAIDQGQARADELLPLVYEELRKLAAARMAQESPGQTLQPTALVHEAWLRLAGDANPKFSGRAHFFAAAAEAMRRILIDRARRKSALRHGGGQTRVDIQQIDLASPDADD